MYTFDHKTLQLPVHPGDTIYWIDEKAGWSVEETTAAAVVIAEDQLMLTRPEDPEPKEIGTFYFLNREEAVNYANEIRPEPPYVFGHETEKWIPADLFIPDFHGWKYVQTTDEEGNTLYFDPKDKTLREDYPTHSLIAQNKLDTTTEITADCNEFAKSSTQKLTKICNNIYQDNKLIKMDYTKYSYHFFPDELAQYLGYLGKNYIIRESVGSYSFSVYDLDKKTTVEGLTSIPSISPDNKASYIYASAQGDQITYYNILTDKTVTASPSSRAELGINYLAIDDGSEITYYNKNAEEIYKIQKGE